MDILKYNTFFNYTYSILFLSVTFVDSRTNISMTQVYALKKQTREQEER